jgi:hypothetical protein
VPPLTAAVVLGENESARVQALRAALATLAVIATLSLFFTRHIPAEQPGRIPKLPDVKKNA